MSTYICEICGYCYDEDEAGVLWNDVDSLWTCPLCSAPKRCFKCADEPIKESITPPPSSSSDVYVCEICGYRYEEQENPSFLSLPDEWRCPLCSALKASFKIQPTTTSSVTSTTAIEADSLLVSQELRHHDDSLESAMSIIHEMAVEGHSRIEAMRTHQPVPDFKDILLLGAQLGHFPLPDQAHVDTKTMIGSSAKKPMIIDFPVFVSHMSFGALSKEAKIALAKGSAAAHSAQCSGEGGILPEEHDQSYRYIFEYVPNKYSVSDENLCAVDAIEIKIGQGSKPGMGGHLPKEKVTEEISQIRMKPMGEDIISPSRFEEIKTKDDLKDMVDMLRLRSDGRPIGIKIAAGHIEDDLEWIQYAQPDFITIDGRGGATGASPKYLKDNATIPTIYALARARAYMKEHGMKQELVITGGFRTSGDMIKAIAMGASAIAIASAAMMAIGCQQYRICHNGRCPMGIATQDPELRKRFDIEKGAKRLENYLKTLHSELISFARITGHTCIHDVTCEDLCTTNDDIAKHTEIDHC